MKENNLNLIYDGEINQSITKAFISLAEDKLTEKKEDKSIIRKVYHVMVECLQNIYKHSDENAVNKPGKKSHGIFLVAHHAAGYVISTGNKVDQHRREELTEILDRINGMSVEELNTTYKKQMREGALSEKGGAGLGFIDICRKTGSKLEYKFETLDEKYSFFILKTYIAK